MRPDRPGLPYANAALTLFVNSRIAELSGVRTQREIAAAAGFTKPNFLSMIKHGETKAPLSRIPALARALDADPAHMFRLGMADLWPELAPLVWEIFGRQMASKNEVDILLTKWRAATGNMDPASTAQIEAAVDAMLADLFRE